MQPMKWTWMTLHCGEHPRASFKVRQRGYSPWHDDREPISSFMPCIDTPFMEKYCQL